MGRDARRRQALPKDTTLGEQWADYYEKLLRPAGAGEVQVEETRQAFYAGALCMFHLVSNAGANAPDGEAGEEEGARRMEAILREAEDYFVALGKRMQI